MPFGTVFRSAERIQARKVAEKSPLVQAAACLSAPAFRTWAEVVHCPKIGGTKYADTHTEGDVRNSDRFESLNVDGK